MKTIKLPIRGIVYGFVLRVVEAALFAWLVHHVVEFGDWRDIAATVLAFLVALDVLLASAITNRSVK